MSNFPMKKFGPNRFIYKEKVRIHIIFAFKIMGEFKRNPMLKESKEGCQILSILLHGVITMKLTY